MSLTETDQISAALLSSPLQDCTLPCIRNTAATSFFLRNNSSSNNDLQMPHNPQPTAGGAPSPSSSASISASPPPASPQPPQGPPILSSLFISNIPCKIREEEIVALFEGMPGYLSGRLRRTKMGNYIAFIDFDTPKNAILARTRYNGYNFDSKTVPPNAVNLPKHIIKKHGILIDFSRANGNNNNDGANGMNGNEASLRPLVGKNGGVIGGNGCIYANGQGIVDNVSQSNGYFNSLFYSPEFDSTGRLRMLGVEDNTLATLYVEGLPCDVTKREVSHIFRHYQGFKDIRIIPKEDKTTRKMFILCFVDFETREDAASAMKELQGYKMDLELPEQRGLTIYFARTGKIFKH